MWYLPPETTSVSNAGGNNRDIASTNVCATPKGMLRHIQENVQLTSNAGGSGSGSSQYAGISGSILDKCCQPANYFENKPAGAVAGQQSEKAAALLAAKAAKAAAPH